MPTVYQTSEAPMSKAEHFAVVEAFIAKYDPDCPIAQDAKESARRARIAQRADRIEELVRVWDDDVMFHFLLMQFSGDDPWFLDAIDRVLALRGGTRH